MRSRAVRVKRNLRDGCDNFRPNSGSKGTAGERFATVTNIIAMLLASLGGAPAVLPGRVTAGGVDALSGSRTGIP
jgi:hypothetical protein